MKRIAIVMLALALLLAFAAPALATTGADGAGHDFGLHHADHAKTMQGFTGSENPGVTHEGFSGWLGEG